MSSRQQILNTLKKNQPPQVAVPNMADTITPIVYDNPAEKFTTVLQGIGATVISVASLAEIVQYVQSTFPAPARVVSVVPELSLNAATADFTQRPQALENVALAVLRGQFGVAENGAVWITDNAMGDRALPFIAAHLALIISKSDIVNTMQEAYQRIGSTTTHEFGTFIAGPSKTADIEQSLVLGAHGPKSMAVFLVG
jgi:L-lactate dehydrogenase complex protein LldG